MPVSIFDLTTYERDSGNEDQLNNERDITQLLKETCYPGAIQLYSCQGGGPGGAAQLLSQLFEDCEVSGYDATIPTWYDWDVGMSVAHLVSTGNRITYVNGNRQ